MIWRLELCNRDLIFVPSPLRKDNSMMPPIVQMFDQNFPRAGVGIDILLSLLAPHDFRH